MSLLGLLSGWLAYREQAHEAMLGRENVKVGRRKVAVDVHVPEAEAAFLLGEVAETPDITLAELQEKLKARGVNAGIGTLWRFFERRRVTFKKRRRMLGGGARPQCAIPIVAK